MSRRVCYAAPQMSDVQHNIKAFERMKTQLESEHLGEWVLVHERKLISVYNSFEDAADEAVTRFGRGPFLIRQVGARPITLPSSVMYHRPDAER